ncbi:putative ankyrin repeat protein RF_0381 [Haliotis asinina]|uniref:putative ankyrin repeat protein RF_0381 n=1 Tax=Haliotis asinina TaxID=109174 RepID=UPI00353249FA
MSTLTCYLSQIDHDATASETHYFVGAKDLAKIRAGSCELETCPSMRCLETRTGKTECVKEKLIQTQAYTEPNTTLFDACMVGDLARVKSILSDNKTNVNSRKEDNMTPVMYAAQEGHKEVFDLLVREGANLSLVDDEDRNILHLACTGGNVDVVKYVLMQKIVSVNSQDKYGWTPAMKAAFSNSNDVFGVLVEARADLVLVNDEKETILHVACQGGNVDIIQYLLTKDIVDIDRQDESDWTPVMHAAKCGHKDVFDVLVEGGADLSIMGKNKINTLHLACKGGNVEIIKYLLKHDTVDINSRDEKGWTPIMHGAKFGHEDVFDVLVEGGADLSLVNGDRETILHLACKGDNVEIIKYLLKHDTVDINSRDEKGWTPIMHGASLGDKDVFDVLIDKGADLSQVGEDKETILHLACEGNNVEIIKYLLNHSIVDIDSRDEKGWTPIMHGASHGHKDVFDVLVEAGADLSLVNGYRETILHLACKGGNVEIIKYLLKHDTVGINSRNMNGWTPVMHTVFEGHNDAFGVLVEAGVDLSQVTNDNETILHVACEWEHLGIIKYLLTHNTVDINSRDDWGLTPVMRATVMGRENAFNLLVKWRADLSLLDDCNDNILHLACRRDSIEIVKYLLTNNIVDINSRNGDDYTPVMIAAREGYEAPFFLLVENGADLTAMNDAGDNILNLACEGENTHIVKYVSTRHIVATPYREDDPC